MFNQNRNKMANTELTSGISEGQFLPAVNNAEMTEILINCLFQLIPEITLQFMTSQDVNRNGINR